jgi:intracellular sulfur oxidation DsrE/DsrF family protein
MRSHQSKSNKAALTGAALMTSLSLISASAIADPGKSSGLTNYLSECKYMPTVLALMNPSVKNETVCIDMPVGLDEPKVVFNLDTPLADANGRPTGLRHMHMVGTALLARIKAGKLDARYASVVGVMHGSGLDWALNPNDQTRGLIEEIYKLKNAGLDINLEVCGVTMQGKGKTRENLYQSKNGVIHINQGAVARIMDLERHGYAYMQAAK